MSPTIQGGAEVPEVSSAKKPPTQVEDEICMSEKSALETGQEMDEDPKRIVTFTFVLHAVSSFLLRVEWCEGGVGTVVTRREGNGKGAKGKKRKRKNKKKKMERGKSGGVSNGRAATDAAERTYGMCSSQRSRP